jgi:superfamily I DNA/RNA helicase
MQWSPQQSAFLDWAVTSSGSCVLEAVAGAGKTTTLIEAASRMPGQVAIMAYNRKIADEIRGKLADREIDWKKAQANTVHGFGMGAYRKARPNVRVYDRKVADIVEALIPESHPLVAYRDSIVKLVSLAKQLAYGIVCPANNPYQWFEMAEHFDVFDDDDGYVPKNDIIDIAIEALAASSRNLDVIDFDDMIYMPLLHRIRFWQYDVIMVDEAQDTNAARRALVRAMLRKGGRVIAVGDRHQAIYGFTGADADSLDLIAKDFNCKQLPLTVSYRCPKAVIAFAQQWVSHIQAAPSAPEGGADSIEMEAFLKRDDLDGRSAVLSRTTKPLVSLAFKMLRQRTPCRIEGRDIGQRLIKTIQRWKVKTLDGLEDRLDSHLSKMTTKLLAKKQEGKLAEVEDMVETLKVIIDQCRLEKKDKVSDAVEYVEAMFADGVDRILTLSTIHKSKGREWPNVFWLDRIGTCPSKWARQQWQQEQEKNLCYVAATRAQECLFDLLPERKPQ